MGLKAQFVIELGGVLGAAIGAVLFAWLGIMMWKLATRKADRSALVLALGFWSLTIFLGSGAIGTLLSTLRWLSQTQDQFVGQIVRGSLIVSAVLLTVGFLIAGPPGKKP